MNQVNDKRGRKISHWYTGKVIDIQDKDKVCIAWNNPIELESWEELVSFKWNKERSCGCQMVVENKIIILDSDGSDNNESNTGDSDSNSGSDANRELL